jgi:hypothetical protein
METRMPTTTQQASNIKQFDAGHPKTACANQGRRKESIVRPRLQWSGKRLEHEEAKS